MNLGRRLRALYERGDTHPLEVILGARSFGAAITELDNLERTAQQDRVWIERSQALRRRLERLSRSLADQRQAITHLRRSTRATLAALVAAEAEREAEAPSVRRLADRDAPPLPPAPTPQLLVTPLPMLTVVASAYALTGFTATGTPVAYGTVAVDPAVIPLGTRLSIPGYGDGVAVDTGSAIRGARIDVWFPTIDEARFWGTRTVRITIQRG